MSLLSADLVELELDLTCIVGILPRERVTEQRLEVRVELALPLGGVGETGDLSAGIDYAAVDGAVRFLAIEGRFRLIESLALAILRWVLAPPGPGESRAAVDEARVRLAKPEVMPRAKPAVCVARAATERGAGRGGVTTEVLVQVPEARVTRVCVPRGERWEAPRGSRCWPEAGPGFEGPATVLVVDTSEPVSRSAG